MKTKKLLAFIIAMVFVVSVCPFAYAADEITLTYEDVTGSQAPTAIVSDLSLPTGYTWTSNSEAITIGTEADGVIPATVTRAIREDKAVTLTAAKDGATKSFDLTVKAKEVKVIASGTSAGGVQDVFTGEKIGSASGFTDADATETLSIATEADGNYYQRYNFVNTGSYVRYPLTEEQMALVNDASKITIEFDFFWNVTDCEKEKTETTEVNPIDFAMGMKNHVGGTKLAKLYPSGKINIGADGTGVQGTFTTSSTDGEYWNHIKFEFDMYTGALEATINNASTSLKATCYCDKGTNAITEQDFMDAMLGNGLDIIYFAKGYSSRINGVLGIDNYCVYAEAPEELSEADQKAYAKAYLDSLSFDWSDFSDESASAVTAISGTFDNAGGLINWMSDNDAITFEDAKYTTTDGSVSVTVGRKAVVTQPTGKLNANCIITATPKDGDAKNVFNVSVMPKNYSTDFNSTSSTAQILKDFEDDSDDTDGDGKVDVESKTSNGYNSGVSKWYTEKSTTDTAASVTYVTDDTKGNVATISGAGTTVRLAAGSASDTHTNSTLGMDIKFAGGEADSVAFTLGADSAKLAEVTVGNGYVSFKCGSTTKKFDVTTSDWFRLDVDTNLASRTSDLYINGTKMNDEPLVNLWHNTTGSVSAPIRYMTFAVTGDAVMSMDNISAICSTNEDLTLAEAGVIWAKLYKDKITTTDDMTLPVKGPKFQNAVQFAKGTYSTGSGDNTVYYDFDGATLTWTENGDAVTEIDVTKPYVHSYTLTATSGSETATTTINITESPVVISVADGTVKVTGDTSNGKLIVATMSGDRLADVKVYDSFDDEISVAGNYKLIFVDFKTLAPKAFAISK